MCGLCLSLYVHVCARFVFLCVWFVFVSVCVACVCFCMCMCVWFVFVSVCMVCVSVCACLCWCEDRGRKKGAYEQANRGVGEGCVSGIGRQVLMIVQKDKDTDMFEEGVESITHH